MTDPAKLWKAGIAIFLGLLLLAYFGNQIRQRVAQPTVGIKGITLPPRSKLLKPIERDERFGNKSYVAQFSSELSWEDVSDHLANCASRIGMYEQSTSTSEFRSYADEAAGRFIMSAPLQNPNEYMLMVMEMKVIQPPLIPERLQDLGN